MRLGRGPLDDLAERQLDLFEADESDLLLEAREAEQAWNDADRDDAEEAYGDFQLVVDAIADRLVEIRAAYDSTLSAETSDDYHRAFSRAVRRRFSHYATVVADLDDTAR